MLKIQNNEPSRWGDFSKLVKVSKKNCGYFNIYLSAKVAWPRLIGLEFFPNDGEVRLVRRKPEHDEIGVGAAQDVMRVGIVIGLGALPPDEVHDLVLALARNIGIRENYLREFTNMS